jgi:hypothetical protein
MCHVEVVARVRVIHSFETMDNVSPKIHVSCEMVGNGSVMFLGSRERRGE